MEYIENIYNRARHAGEVAVFIVLGVVVLLFAVLVISEYIVNYRRMRRCGLGRFRSLLMTCRYTYYFCFESSEYGLAVTKYFKQKHSKELVIPEGVAEVYRFAFKDGDYTSVTLPKSLRSIGDSAFMGCPVMLLDIPENVGHIGKMAFARCKNLRNVSMPFVKDIDFSAFLGCTKLVTVNIAGNVKEMKYGGLGFTWVLYYITAIDEAQAGLESAEEYVTARCAEMMDFFIKQSSIASLEKMLTLPFILPAGDIDKAIDSAIENECREMYLMLVQYKRDRLGFEGDEGTEDRFEL